MFCSVKKTKTCSCHDRHLSPTNVTRLLECYARQPGVTTVTRVTSVTLLAERSLFLHLSLFFFFHNSPLTPFNPKLIPINFQTSTTSFHHIYIHYPYHLLILSFTNHNHSHSNTLACKWRTISNPFLALPYKMAKQVKLSGHGS